MAITARLPATQTKAGSFPTSVKTRIASSQFVSKPSLSINSFTDFDVAEIANNQTVTFNSLTRKYEPVDLDIITQQIGVTRVEGGTF